MENREASSLEQEDYKEIVRRESDTYFEFMSQKVGLESGTVAENVQKAYARYQKLISEGNYFTRSEEQKSPYEFFQGALTKYEHFQGVYAEEREALSKDYEQRAKQVREILEAMEQDAGFEDFIGSQDGGVAEKAE